MMGKERKGWEGKENMNEEERERETEKHKEKGWGS